MSFGEIFFLIICIAVLLFLIWALIEAIKNFRIGR